MKIVPHRAASALAIAAATLCSTPALGALRDRGPQDALLAFPLWYRDSSGLAAGLCRSQARSPNPEAGLSPMCFPTPTDPAGFPGNLGPELFYGNLTVKIASPGFSLKYVAALEASYSGTEVPAHGSETVFARVRIVIDTVHPGTYRVTHPFGVEVFPDVRAGERSVFFTVDVPADTPAMDFDSALGGRVGPFIQWDRLEPGETLTVEGEQFLGDPNYPHSFTGSPFGTNFVQVDGPPGADLDGKGSPSVLERRGLVLGQRWLAPIATPFSVRKAVYSRNAARNVVDVWASAAPGQLLVVTGAGMPSVELAEYPAGSYHAHVEYPSHALRPSSVTVSNLSSAPVSSASVALVDRIVAAATYSPADRILRVTATSSDLSLPALAVIGPTGGPMAPPSGRAVTFRRGWHIGLPAAPDPPYAFEAVLPPTEPPPAQVVVQSSAGGSAVAEVTPTDGAPMNGPGLPVAADDALAVAGDGPTALDVGANDSWSGDVQVLVLTPPANGTAAAAPSGTAVVFTPRAGASGADSFTYVLRDAAGVSNVATVRVSVPLVSPAPTARPDAFAMLHDTAAVLPVLANDAAGPGASLDPASVTIAAAPARGTALANPDGTVTYRPAAGLLAGIDAFSYAVANGAGVFSTAATVTVAVFPGAEVITFTRAQYVAAKSRWVVVGATSWASRSLPQTTATCWIGTAVAPEPSTLIGSAVVDEDGKFQVVPPESAPAPPNPSTITCQTSSGGRGSTGVAFP